MIHAVGLMGLGLSKGTENQMEKQVHNELKSTGLIGICWVKDRRSTRELPVRNGGMEKKVVSTI